MNKEERNFKQKLLNERLKKGDPFSGLNKLKILSRPRARRLRTKFVRNHSFYLLFMLKFHQRHFYHLVTPSGWPFLIAFNLFNLIIGGLSYMHFFGGYLFIFGLINLIFIISLWIRDVIREGTYEGMHTKIVQKNLKFGFISFILSEIMFFFGFFWAFFHCSLSPGIEIGCVWPPYGIDVINPFKLPLLNTILLLLSGIYITICHMYIRLGIYRIEFNLILITYLKTLICGSLFTCIQIYEYIIANFSIADGIYGSIFYMLTGFHGAHVLAGSIFIITCFFRTLFGHFSDKHHVGFECAAWYWHFVDIVWLFLYIFIYLWGNL